MPNNFLTIGLCGRDYDLLDSLGKVSFEQLDWQKLNGANLCELICKLPKELESIAASNPRFRYRHKETGEWFGSCNGPPGIDREQWERVDLSNDEISALKAKYGAADWHEWQLKEWGTKWGTYGLKVHEIDIDGLPLLIEFKSAWGPPSPEMMRKIDTYLCTTYCLKNIKWIGHNPADGSTLDIEIAPAC